MAPREGSSIAPHGGVVDERLNVHGVKGLKVCDLSICPDNVGCNTFSVSAPCILDVDTPAPCRAEITKPIDCSADWREMCGSCRGGSRIFGRRIEDGSSHIQRARGGCQSGSSVTLQCACFSNVDMILNSQYDFISCFDVAEIQLLCRATTARLLPTGFSSKFSLNDRPPIPFGRYHAH